MNSLRKDKILCDCTLISIDNSTFPVHKCMLAAASPYFQTLFFHNSNNQQQQHLDVNTAASSEQLTKIIEFIYTGKLQVNDVHDIEQLIPLASHWLISSLLDRCAQSMMTLLSIHNCIGLWMLAEYYSCRPKTFRDFVLYHLKKVADNNDEWTNLPTNRLVELLENDRLNVKCEFDVWTIIRKWTSATGRGHSLPHLLPTIRFQNENNDRLLQVVADDHLLPPSMRSLIFWCAKRPQRLRQPRDLVLVVGGWSRGGPSDVIEVYNSKIDQWHRRADVSEGQLKRAYHALTVVDQRMYVIGGYDTSDYYNTVSCWDSRTDTWTERAPMYHARCYVSAAVLDDIIFVCGGYDGHERLSSAEKYDSVRNQWTQIGNMQNRRSDAAMAVHQGRLFIAGGFTGDIVLDSVEIYLFESDTWQTVTFMKTPRSGLALIDSDQLGLLAMGGYDGQRRLRTVERYDLQEWQFITPMLHTRSNFGAVQFNDQVMVIGGFDGTKTMNLVERLDENGQWTVMESLTVSRSGLKVCLIQDCSKAILYCGTGN